MFGKKDGRGIHSLSTILHLNRHNIYMNCNPSKDHAEKDGELLARSVLAAAFLRGDTLLSVLCDFLSILQRNADIHHPDCSFLKQANCNTLLSPFLTPDRGYLSVNRPA